MINILIMLTTIELMVIIVPFSVIHNFCYKSAIKWIDIHKKEFGSSDDAELCIDTTDELYGNVKIEENINNINLYFNHDNNLNMHELDILFKKLLTLDKNKNLNIFLKTYGGFSNVCNNICNELKQWKGKTSVYIKDFAYSAGTVIALSADKLYIGKNGKLSAINPMCSWFDKKYLCDFWASLLLPNPEKNDSDTINLINKKYKFDNIIKCMYVDVKKHATFYNLEEVTKIVGKNISISRKYKKILGYINKYYHSWTPTRSSIKYFFY